MKLSSNNEINLAKLYLWRTLSYYLGLHFRFSINQSPLPQSLQNHHCHTELGSLSLGRPCSPDTSGIVSGGCATTGGDTTAGGGAGVACRGA